MTTKNGDMPAMPTFDYDVRSNDVVQFTDSAGLTKREMMAMHMMAACRSRNSDYRSWDDMAKDAIEITDALLAELERTK